MALAGSLQGLPLHLESVERDGSVQGRSKNPRSVTSALGADHLPRRETLSYGNTDSELITTQFLQMLVVCAKKTSTLALEELSTVLF